MKIIFGAIAAIMLGTAATPSVCAGPSAETASTQAEPQTVSTRPSDIHSLVQNFQKQRDDFLKEDRKLTAQLKSATGEERTRLFNRIKEMRHAWLEEQKQLRTEIKLRLADSKNGDFPSERTENQMEQRSSLKTGSQIPEGQNVIHSAATDKPVPRHELRLSETGPTSAGLNVESLNSGKPTTFQTTPFNTDPGIVPFLKIEPIKPKVEKYSGPTSGAKPSSAVLKGR